MKKLNTALLVAAFSVGVLFTIPVAASPVGVNSVAQVVPETKKITKKTYHKGRHITATTYRHGKRYTKRGYRKGHHWGHKAARKTKHVMVGEPKRP